MHHSRPILARSVAVFLAVLRQAVTTGYDTATWPLAWSLSDYLNRRGHWREWAEVQHVAIAATRRIGDRAGHADAYRSLAGAYIKLERFDEAETEYAGGVQLS